ncbi:DUF2721 domain-containing protein [Mesorhizobium sp.]|uniref:DUF2721 domain-containing protein n=1 Tax=Mesorhizobium sp. TaxID=1871066 RepID=UPI00257FB7CE|nr:DUF2721 domain-containing protein [Mesorhizobium sp.]
MNWRLGSPRPARMWGLRQAPVSGKKWQMSQINADQLSTMISHAVAPSFLLTAIAALVSILIARMTRVTDRLRNLNQIADDDVARGWLKADVSRLKRREILLNQSLHLVVTSGIAIAVLLLFGFVASLVGYRHEPGAGILFVVALVLLIGSLLRFLQDIRIALSEHDHHG